MARIISVTSPADKTEALLEELKTVDGLLELQVFRDVSIDPPGDVIKFGIPNVLLPQIMRLLDKYQLGEKNGISLSSSDPDSYIPTSPSYNIERDINQASWEEMQMTISNDSNTSINTLIIMFISGSLATIGLATNALHIVIGGMLVAPGFMPVTRMSLGLIGKSKTWQYGGIDFLKGYLALIIGAMVTAVMLKAMGQNPLSPTADYYAMEKNLVTYWTTVTASSLLASAVASIAGALLVATKKSVFTSGVMIGLALVPTAAIVGVGIMAGDFELAQKAFIRFILDVMLVFIFSLVVFLWVRLYYLKRDIKLH